MLYFDYVWDLTPNTIVPDPELNTDQLDWKPGDLFQVQERNGRNVLVRVNKLEKSVAQGVEHG
jgi:hypothetical protein